MDEIKILIAEDAEMIRVLLVQQIKNLNCQFIFVTNGLEAFNLLKYNEFDLVLMDIEMPVLDGKEAIVKIRSELPFPKSSIPVVAMTGHNDYLYIQDLENLGFNAHLPKPFSPGNLEKVVKEVLARHKVAPVPEPVPELEPQPEPEPVGLSISYDISALNDFAQGDDSFINEMVQFIVSDMPKQIIRLIEAFQEQDFVQVRMLAHKIAPQLAYFNVLELVDVADQIEELALKSGQAEHVKQLIATLEIGCNQLVMMLKADFKLLSE
jgi:CheY-like chemotaxis protein/HPt (histidine-containing phosphotransfer) domain-containing protein